MAEMYFIRPDNADFLASVSDHPLIKQVKIKEIAIDPVLRKWTLHMDGARAGTEEFWDDIARKLKSSIPEVDYIEFAWEEKSDE